MAGRCAERVSELVVQCTECEGVGCRYCDSGRVGVPECPQKMAADLGEFWDAADMMENGIPPVAGGSLDQAAWFVRLYNRLKADEGRFGGEGYRPKR